MIGTGQDITERKRFEDALHESEERFRSIFQNARDVIFTLSMDGTITSNNPIFETITGWSFNEWIGKPFTDILHPDDVREAQARYQRIFQKEIPITREWRIRSKSGEYLMGEFSTTPQLLNGKVIGALGIARDITARKRAEQALQESEERHRTILDTASDAIIMIDEESRILSINKAAEKIFGYTIPEMTGNNLTILMPDYLKHLHKAAVRRYIDTGQSIFPGKVQNFPDGTKMDPRYRWRLHLENSSKTVNASLPVLSTTSPNGEEQNKNFVNFWISS